MLSVVAISQNLKSNSLPPNITTSVIVISEAEIAKILSSVSTVFDLSCHDVNQCFLKKKSGRKGEIR